MAEKNAGSVGEAATTGRSTTERQGAIQGQAGDARDWVHLLTQAGLALLSDGDPEAHLETLTSLATRLTCAQSGAFFHSIDGESGGEYTLGALCARGLQAQESHLSEITVQVSEPSIRTEDIVRLSDVSTHPLRAHAQSLAMPTSHLRVRSFMSVPVRSRSGGLLGGLFFGHTEPDRFAEVDEGPLRLIAVHIALAIEHAHLDQADQEARGRRVALNARWKRKVAERTAARDQSEQQFQQLVAGVRDCAIYMLDANGYVVSWNPGAERIKGYTAEEVLGQHFRIFCTQEDQASGEPERSLSVALNSGKYESEAWRRRKDGTCFWASVLIDPVWNNDGELLGFAKITRDMTERRAMQEQLYHSQKMEALGQLTGGVVHDFNNLLTVILGNLETLGRDLPKEQHAVLHRAVEQASRGARRAAALTRQLLAFSRRQPLTPTPTDANRLVTGAVELMKQALGESVRVDTVLHSGLWLVDIDVPHFESALLNLAVNARDAMPGGGTLTIETTNVHVDEKHPAKLGTRHGAVRPGDYVVVCIRDTGLGMTEEVMERAFDPFFTTKPVGKGTGLGLSQVFGFVNQSGGYLQLHSTVGAGTRVEIYLPRMTRIVPPQEGAPSLPAPVVAAVTDATILVVEDEEDVRVYSADSLREQGFTVLEAQDSDSAMRMLDQHPEVWMMFTDIGLPHVDGWQLADQARMRLPGLKVLFATGYARDAVTRLERMERGEQILMKPFTGSQLIERVREVLASAPPPSLPKSVRVALVVEDEPLVSLYLAETLGDLGFKVMQSASAAEAGEMAERIEPPVLAVIDIGLPDRSGLELAEELLHRWPHMKLAIASGYGEQALGNLRNSPGVTFLTKPYDDDDIAAAIKTLGVQS